MGVARLRCRDTHSSATTGISRVTHADVVTRTGQRRDPQRQRATRVRRPVLWLSLLLLALVVASFPVGQYWVPPYAVLEILGSHVFPIGGHWPPTMDTVVMQVRLPRILGAIAIGAALSGSGAAYQSMFRNPLVSPGILGVASGAGFGAALAILLHLPWAVVQLMAFGFGLLATSIAFVIGRVLGSGSLVVLVLGGMVVSALFGAFISLTQYFANPNDTLPEITFWLMGALDRVELRGLLPPYVLMVICLAILYVLRWQINVLAAGDDEARTLGVSRTLIWGIVIAAATLMTATAVSMAGTIGWVGLIIPHAARFLVGPSFDRVLPAAILLGASFMLVVDDVARSVTTVELPLGILTSVIGAPCFLLMLAQARRQWL